MRIHRILLIFLVCLFPGLLGCSPSISGGPDLRQYRSFSEEYFKQGYSQSRLNAYASEVDAGKKKSLRNSIVLSAMGSIDTKYAAFESAMTREGQQVPFVAEIASLGLSGAGTLVASAATKTTLAAVDTGLKGAKSAYDTNILAEKTVQFLQKQMRTNRNKVRSSIVGKLSLGVGQYPLELALIDVEQYATAGTIAAGLIGIDEKTSQGLTASEEAKVSEIFSYAPDENSAKIRALRNSGSAKIRDAISSWIQNEKVDSVQFLFSADHADSRRRLVAHLESLGAG